MRRSSLMAEGNGISSLSPKDLVLQLMNLRQSSSVQAYIDRFDETLTHVKFHVDLPEAFSMSCFRGGLRPDIAGRVRRLHPTSLHQAFSDAKLVETLINLEQIASKYSQPSLKSYTHEAHNAASTLVTKLEHDKRDEILELAIEINEAKVTAVDIADDDAFKSEQDDELNTEAHPEHDTNSDADGAESAINSELVEDNDDEMQLSFADSNLSMASGYKNARGKGYGFTVELTGDNGTQIPAILCNKTMKIYIWKFSSLSLAQCVVVLSLAAGDQKCSLTIDKQIGLAVAKMWKKRKKRLKEKGDVKSWEVKATRVAEYAKGFKWLTKNKSFFPFASCLQTFKHMNKLRTCLDFTD